MENGRLGDEVGSTNQNDSCERKFSRAFERKDLQDAILHPDRIISWSASSFLLFLWDQVCSTVSGNFYQINVVPHGKFPNTVIRSINFSHLLQA